MPSLSSKSIGNPDNAFIWYLHSGGNATNTGAAALTAGFQVQLGDGAETPLWIGSTGIGIRSGGGFVSKISSQANAACDVAIGKGSGTLFPALTAILVSDVIHSSLTPATVDASNFKVALVASTVYNFEISLIVSSAFGGGVAPRFVMLGPTQVEYVYYELFTNDGHEVIPFSAWPGDLNNPTVPPGANMPYFLTVRGVCKTTSTAPVNPVQLQIYSPSAGNAVTLKAGSSIRFTAR